MWNAEIIPFPKNDKKPKQKTFDNKLNKHTNIWISPFPIFIGMNFVIAFVPIYLLLREGIASPSTASYCVQGQNLKIAKVY